MSDVYEYWFFPWIKKEDVARVESEVIGFLLSNGFIAKPTGTPQWQMDEDYVLTEKFWGDSNHNIPVRHHHWEFEVWTEGFKGFVFNEIEKITCPECEYKIEDSEMQKLYDLVGRVFESQEFGHFTCSNCEEKIDIRRLESSPPLSFGRLGFKFHGCPRDADGIYPEREHLPAQFESIRSTMERIGGSEVRVSWYRI